MNTYGIFWQREPRTDSERGDVQACAMWALLTRKRDALRHGKRLGAVVGVMRNQTRYDVWDAPTFRVCMDVLADYRKD